jgi:DNA invertase Pin-like site-specific DNA recombinase
MQIEDPEQTPMTGRLIGYARVSTEEQILDLQTDALTRAGVAKSDIYVEKISGASTKARPKLRLMMKSVRAGDTILVWRLDRLGRNAIDLHTLTKQMADRGIGFRSLTEGFETITAMGKLMFGVFAAFAEFERNLTIERTKAGMAAARSRGRIPGAKPKFTAEQKAEIKQRLATGEIGVRALAKELGVSATTITNARK